MLNMAEKVRISIQIRVFHCSFLRLYGQFSDDFLFLLVKHSEEYLISLEITVFVLFQDPSADDISREEMYVMTEEIDQHLNMVSSSKYYV